MQGTPTDKPVGVNIKVYLSGGNQGDIDNYAKSLTDSLNKIAYADDRQIKVMQLRKIECKKEEERAEVEIYVLDSLGNIANH